MEGTRTTREQSKKEEERMTPSSKAGSVTWMKEEEVEADHVSDVDVDVSDVDVSDHVSDVDVDVDVDEAVNESRRRLRRRRLRRRGHRITSTPY